MPMSMKLTDAEISEIQHRYRHLLNYESDDPEAPIDPMTYRDSNGDHLLHIAARLGDLATVMLLTRAGVHIDLLGDMGCTPLHYAMQKKHDQVVNYLRSQGASDGIRNQFGKLAGE